MLPQEAELQGFCNQNGFFGFPNLLVERELGVSATTRNWTTVSKIARWMRMEADGAISAKRSLAGKCESDVRPT